MQAAVRALPGGEDVEITVADVWPHVGLPLEATAALLVPGHEPETVVREYRARYEAVGARMVSLMPGALEAVAAVREHAGRVLVVSAKAEAGVQQSLAQVGLQPDLVAGGLFAAAKGVRLRTESADVYVGDHPGDVEAASVAGAVAVAVATGAQPPGVLVEAGADVVLTDLAEFPAWLSSFLPRLGRSRGSR